MILPKKVLKSDRQRCFMNYRMVLRKSDAKILEKEWVDLTCTVL